jgi:putative DNA primase/helicase
LNTPVDVTDPEQTIRAEVEATKKELESLIDKKVHTDPKKTPVEFTFDQLKKAFHQNEFGDADVTVPLFQNRFVRDNCTGEFYIFRDHRWHSCMNREHEAAFREVADVYGKGAIACKKRADEAEKNGEAPVRDREKRWQSNFNERANKLRGNARMRNVLNLATAGDNSLGISGENWNIDPRMLPAVNGVIDLETGKLRQGKYDDWFFHGSPIEYKGIEHGGAFVPDLLSKLLCDDAKIIEYMELLLGFCCTGIQTKDFFVAYGPLGNNGKSVLFDWVSYVLGGFASSVPVEMAYEDRFGRDPDKPSPQLLNLRGLRMAIMSEPEANKRLSHSKVKFLTSGTDKISARNLNEKKLITFWPSHTLIMHGNEIPQVHGNQHAFYDRLKIIPFRARFIKNDDEVDEKHHVYKQVPRAEMDRFLRKHDTEMLSFLVRCARKALFLGDMPPAPSAIDDEVKIYREDQDIVGRYLKICVDQNPLAEEQAKDLYESFAFFCNTELGLGFKSIPSQKKISPELRSQPYIERNSNGRTVSYRGIQIKPEWVPNSDWLIKFR